MKIREQSLDCARSSFEEVEQAKDTTMEETFQHLYLEMPDTLAAQMQRRKT